MTPDQTTDVLNFDPNAKPALPQALNVLTILTFIGCGLSALLTLLLPMLYNFLLGVMDKAASSGEELSAKELEDMEKGRAVIELSQQNMVPLIIIGMIGIILCFVGALWMRKLKKDGYWMYVAGQVIPLIGSFVILGTKQFTGVGSVLMALVFPLLFVVLYTMQRKHLVN
jgi:hypothetical protein